MIPLTYLEELSIATTEQDFRKLSEEAATNAEENWPENKEQFEEWYGFGEIANSGLLANQFRAQGAIPQALFHEKKVNEYLTENGL